MKADSIHLFDFLGSGKTIFEIPVFQRNYEWGRDQCEQLFKDLTLAMQNDTDHYYRGHCLCYRDWQQDESYLSYH